MLFRSPRSDTIDEAQYFAGRLAASGLTVGAVVVNRCTPDFGEPPARRPRKADLALLYDNLSALRRDAATEREHAARLLAYRDLPDGVHTTWVPTLPGDVHTMASLAAVRDHLFG